MFIQGDWKASIFKNFPSKHKCVSEDQGNGIFILFRGRLVTDKTVKALVDLLKGLNFLESLELSFN